MLADPRLVQTNTTTFELTAARPSRIDLTTVSDDGRTRLTTRGIYCLRGNELCYCIARPGGSRPDAFATQHGDGRTLAILRRVPELTPEMWAAVFTLNPTRTVLPTSPAEVRYRGPEVSEIHSANLERSP